MSASLSIHTNFGQLAEHDEGLLRLGLLAERYFPADPNTALLKLRQFAELLAQNTAARIGLYASAQEPQADLLRRLEENGILTREIAGLFRQVRLTGNAANHALAGDHRTALATLKIAWQLGLWFHRTFTDPDYRAGAFIPPQPPPDAAAEAREQSTEAQRQAAELRAELGRLRAEYEGQRAAFEQQRKAGRDAAERLGAIEAELRAAHDERAFWEEMAAEVEREKAELQNALAERQKAAEARPRDAAAATMAAATTAAAALHLDEAETRLIIDAQLRAAGWEADTAALRYAAGARPEKGRNMAIAEWPTANGPADYVLFVGTTPMAVVEAKRHNVDVAGTLEQAKRYNRGFREAEPRFPATDAEYPIPFAFSTHSRPFLRQLAEKSGIWFCDLRRATNLARPLDGWYTPDGLTELMKLDTARADEQLKAEPFEFGFPLRAYQRAAIEAAERAVAQGRREMLLAMATGTGKTKPCIALVYRLLKARRFGRVLFLVDRTALGEQAANAFKDTRMENLQTFADTFGIKELEETTPDADTFVHIATVQGMVRRLLLAGDDAPPPVDRYDCIVVDECHRGYLLDRELSETELAFRGHDEYISKYRRVLDYFDAVKIGLTATPALHTAQIFGAPIYSYSYREAVIDGFLVDHEPPVQITTELSAGGIVWKTGEPVHVYDARRAQVDLFTAPDEIRIDVEGFNSKVITEAFNATVCEYLARELDPSAPGKTLIFCATDHHALLVTRLLKEAFERHYGDVENDAVMRITGAADRPLELIRRFRNERNPNVAITVDLLTTGIDVPRITNLVFLRRVNSRILFDQMLGRATRLCEEIGKETFRIFDAVRLYEAIGDMTAMKPVVVNPNISFAQLAREIIGAGAPGAAQAGAAQAGDGQSGGAHADDTHADAGRELAREQFIARLRRKQRHLSDERRQDFERVAGMPPEAFAAALRAMPIDEAANWFTARPGLAEILDRTGDGPGRPILVSEHPDSLISAEHGYGSGTRPEDYLREFTAFINGNRNEIPALAAVLTRPRELTRAHLRELALALDAAGFSEASLETAWREKTNQEIAARIVGYIRQAAVGDALIPYDRRVDAALDRILATRPWSAPQRDWLRTIAAQTKANIIVDRAALDDPDQIFKRDGGGFPRLNRIFDGELENVLGTFNEWLWQAA